MVDSHAHLESCDQDVADLVAEAAGEGVERIVTIGMGEDSSRRAVALTERFPGVFAAVGVHPHDAGSFTAADPVWMRELSAHPKVVAIGECGFDHHYDHASHEDQERAFRAQIALAREVGLPLVIHTREATEDTMRVLGEDAAGLPVILHCFSIPERLDDAVERGYMLSLAGPVTYKRSHDLQRAAALAPLDRLLVETDSPYLAPEPRRGRPNRPANVAHTLRFVAALRDMPAEDLDAATSANAARIFGW
ncbi:MAG: TatD family hydrolase [Miltoncostaeaceae bacterium]